MPKVSIIVPVYNKSEYIRKTFDSIITQTYDDFEVVAVNDGSTDDSLEIIKEYSEINPKIRVIDIPNGGVSNARNVGVQNAKGKWIQFLDGDDILDAEYLDKAVTLAENTNADILFSDFVMIDENNRIVKKVESSINKALDTNELCDAFMQLQFNSGFFGFISNKLFNRDLLDKSNAEFDINITLAEDLDFYAQLYPYVSKAVFCSLNSFYYLQTNENYINNSNIDYFSQIKVHLDIKKWFQKVGKYEVYNKELDKRISEYVYFTLFYANENNEDLEKEYIRINASKEIMDSINSQYLSGFTKKVIRAVENKSLDKVKSLFRIRNFSRAIYRKVRLNG